MTSMGCPTKEEYEKALEDKKFLVNAFSMEHKRRDKLIDELCKSQDTLKTYEQAIEYQKNIIQKYEIYQEIQSHYV